MTRMVNIVCKFEFSFEGDLVFPNLCTSSFSLGTVSPLLDLHGSLALNTGCAAEGQPSVLHRVTVNVVPFPGLLPQQQSWDARHDAAQQHIQDTRLAKIISSGVGEAGVTETGTAAYSAVTAAVAKALFPSSSFSHCGLDSLL